MMQSTFKFLVIAVMAGMMSSCSNGDNQIVATSLKKKGDIYTLGYGPEMQFNQITDSVDILFTPDDYSKILGGPVKQSDFIINRDKFQIRLFLYENYSKGQARFRLKLRTYAKDMKIIDEMIIASTLEEELSDGYLTENLKAVRKHKDSNDIVMKIDEYGNFKSVAK
ncbi:hypothetical protein BST97_08660 [Nonlabens spongiae]|uniref:Lipoprotein n=1 Tax=Nonlabens spongiae TaxID=331648 RepID=A0A1W6MKM4_9FLAO|nr:hypothetical protein [Nonlabens spongiae]ARN78066.1 hypothetical protein BST97_08660 [Nonlabens spongiae]